MKNKGKKFIVGVALCVVGIIGLFGLFAETESRAALLAGSVVLIVAGIVLVFLDKKYPSKPKAESGSAEDAEAYVFITENGKKYHVDPDCPGIGNAKRVPLSKAKKQGYTPCSKCQYSYMNNFGIK